LSGPFCPQPPNRDSSAITAAKVFKLAPRLGADLLLCMRRSMNDTDYHLLADALLGRIEAQMDRWLQADVVDIDTHRTGGLLELSMPDGSKLVINKQPPLHEVWLASKAGGYHFGWDGSVWRDNKSGADFYSVFNEQASRQAGRSLVLE
jgi:CyaY protein